jgi:hypothetical protein
MKAFQLDHRATAVPQAEKVEDDLAATSRAVLLADEARLHRAMVGAPWRRRGLLQTLTRDTAKT